MDLCSLLSQAWVPESLGLLVGVALSYLAEYWQGYQGLEPKWKRLIFLGFCLAVPFAALGVAHLASCPFVTWQEALMAGILAFAAGTLAHTRKL